MKAKTKRRRQPPLKGGRVSAYAGLRPAIEARIEEDMAEYGVTRSFVLATAAAWAFGIKEQEDYREPQRKDGALRNKNGGKR